MSRAQDDYPLRCDEPVIGAERRLDLAGPALLPTVLLDGVRMHVLTERQCVEFIVQELLQQRGGWLVSVNVHHLRLCATDPEFAVLCAGATLCMADGMPVIWASRWQRTPLPERVAGSDLISSVADAAQQYGLSLFLLGGSPGIADRAAVNLRRTFPRLRLAGIYVPPFGFESDLRETERIVEVVRAAQPNLVFVALSKGKQERLVDVLRRKMPNSWFLGIGAGLSFASGDIRRAPLWMRRAGLEWMHRLIQEPRRLAGRYLVRDLPHAARFLARTLRRRSARR